MKPAHEMMMKPLQFSYWTVAVHADWADSYNFTRHTLRTDIDPRCLGYLSHSQGKLCHSINDIFNISYLRF